mgnify:CR=1 FL=1
MNKHKNRTLVRNDRMSRETALGLIHGAKMKDLHECIKQGTEEYKKIGCRYPSSPVPRARVGTECEEKEGK